MRGFIRITGDIFIAFKAIFRDVFYSTLPLVVIGLLIFGICFDLFSSNRGYLSTTLFLCLVGILRVRAIIDSIFAVNYVIKRTMRRY